MKENTLHKTYYLLNKDDPEKEKKSTESKWEKGYELPTRQVQFNDFNIPQSRKVKSTRETLSKVLTYIKRQNHQRCTDKLGGLSIIELSVKSNKIIDMCGSYMAASRFIDFMIKIGLLAEYDESYRYNAWDDDDNHSKKYCYNYFNEQKIIAYCKENNISKYEFKNVSKKALATKVNNLDTVDIADVKFNSKLNLKKPTSYSQKQFEDWAKSALYQSYPLLAKKQAQADYLNEKFFKDDEKLKIHYKPNVEFNSKGTSIRKIGIRATSSLCNTKKKFEDKDLNKKMKFKYKLDVLKHYGFNVETVDDIKKYEVDVSASVPRVTKLMNTGVWLDNDIDIYKHMCVKFNGKCPQQALPIWKDNDDKDINRKVFKNFVLPSYFDTYSTVAGHIKRRVALKMDKNQGEVYRRKDWEELDDIMFNFKQSVEEELGPLYDSEIFFHESNIYLDVLQELLEQGRQVIQIYDAFYINEENLNKKEIYKIIEDKAIKYYEEINKVCKEIKLNKVCKERIIDTIVNIFNNSENKEHIEPPDIEELAKLALSL